MPIEPPVTIKNQCTMCLEKAISFDMSINLIMGSISDGVILISPAKLQSSEEPLTPFDSGLSMYLTD